MKIVIAGCRDFADYDVAKEFILRCLEETEGKITIISGGCSGADALGERFAKEYGLKTEIFPADWKTFGRSAGPIRNKQMANECDMLIAFWDYKSKGTANMIHEAKKQNKIIHIKEI